MADPPHTKEVEVQVTVVLRVPLDASTGYIYKQVDNLLWGSSAEDYKIHLDTEL